MNESVKHQFYSKIERVLSALDKSSLSETIRMYPKGLEKIHNCNEPIYAIRYRHQSVNYRILVAAHREDIILLCSAFNERNKSDYDNGIRVARNRYAVLRKEFNL